MAYTVAARAAANQAILDLLSTGTGTAVLRLLAGATTLADVPLDHAASSVSGTTGQLTLVAATGGATWVASGNVTRGQLLGRDGALIDDDIPAQAGVSPVAGYLTMPSLAAVSGGQVDLISYTIG